MFLKCVMVFIMANCLMLTSSVFAISQADNAESRVDQSHLNTITEVINTLRLLQSTQDYEQAYGAVSQLDLAMDDIMSQGFAKVGEDFFKAQTLKSALEVVLVEKKHDLDACYSAKLSLKVDFGLRSHDGSELSPYDYPAMVKEAYFMLDKLCKLYPSSM